MTRAENTPKGVLEELDLLRARVAELERALTDGKLADRRLQRERDTYRGLVQAAQTILLVLDTEGRIVFINPYLEKHM